MMEGERSESFCIKDIAEPGISALFD